MKKTTSELPPDWDQERVRKVLEHYESQTETEAVAEDEAAFDEPRTVIEVPEGLLPRVRELIDRYERSRRSGSRRGQR